VLPAIEKLKEETHEFEEAFTNNNTEEMQNELGDIIFSIVNISRKLGFDSESALKRTIKKFETRFRKIEEHFRKNEKNNA